MDVFAAELQAHVHEMQLAGPRRYVEAALLDDVEQTQRQTVHGLAVVDETDLHTRGGTCDVDYACTRSPFIARDFCYRTRGFGDECADALSAPGVAPLCPNGRCLTRDLVADSFCIADCLTAQSGTGCGDFDTTSMTFNGECFDNGGGGDFICLPALIPQLTMGGICLVNRDCLSDCCNQSSGFCGTANCN